MNELFSVTGNPRFPDMGTPPEQQVCAVILKILLKFKSSNGNNNLIIML
jgi:hypothetical protein